MKHTVQRVDFSAIVQVTKVESLEGSDKAVDVTAGNDISGKKQQSDLDFLGLLVYPLLHLQFTGSFIHVLPFLQFNFTAGNRLNVQK